MTPLEQDIKGAIVDAVNATFRAFCWPTPAGKVRARGGYVQLAPKGMPDILGYMFADGRMVGLEVKRPGKDGRTDPERAKRQREWQTRMRAAGCVVGQVDNPAEAVRIVMAASRFYPVDVRSVTPNRRSR